MEARRSPWNTEQASRALPTAAEADFALGGCDVIRSPAEESVALLFAVVTFQPSERAGAGEWETSRQSCRRLLGTAGLRTKERALARGTPVGVTEDKERLAISRREGESQ